MQYDEIDRKILEILDQDGRTRYTDIAKSIQKTEGTVRNRIKRLQEKGIIHGFRVVTSPENLGYETQALIMFQLEPSYENYIQLEELPHLVELNNSRLISLYRSKGKNTFVLEVACKKSGSLDRILSVLENFKGIKEDINLLIKEEQIYDRFT